MQYIIKNVWWVVWLLLWGGLLIYNPIHTILVLGVISAVVTFLLKGLVMFSHAFHSTTRIKNKILLGCIPGLIAIPLSIIGGIMVVGMAFSPTGNTSPCDFFCVMRATNDVLPFFIVPAYLLALVFILPKPVYRTVKKIPMQYLLWLVPLGLAMAVSALVMYRVAIMCVRYRTQDDVIICLQQRFYYSAFLQVLYPFGTMTLWVTAFFFYLPMIVCAGCWALYKKNRKSAIKIGGLLAAWILIAGFLMAFPAISFGFPKFASDIIAVLFFRY